MNLPGADIAVAVICLFFYYFYIFHFHLNHTLEHNHLNDTVFFFFFFAATTAVDVVVVLLFCSIDHIVFRCHLHWNRFISLKKLPIRVLTCACRVYTYDFSGGRPFNITQIHIKCSHYSLAFIIRQYVFTVHISIFYRDKKNSNTVRSLVRSFVHKLDVYVVVCWQRQERSNLTNYL